MAAGRRARLARLREQVITKRQRGGVKFGLKPWLAEMIRQGASTPAPDPEGPRVCLCGQVNPSSRFECLTCGRRLS